MKVDVNHKTGDVVLHACNGDPILKLQKAGPFMAVSSGRHPLDCRCEVLTPEAVQAIREFCEAIR